MYTFIIYAHSTCSIHRIHWCNTHFGKPVSLPNWYFLNIQIRIQFKTMMCKHQDFSIIFSWLFVVFIISQHFENDIAHCDSICEIGAKRELRMCCKEPFWRRCSQAAQLQASHILDFYGISYDRIKRQSLKCHYHYVMRFENSLQFRSEPIFFMKWLTLSLVQLRQGNWNIEAHTPHHDIK